MVLHSASFHRSARRADNQFSSTCDPFWCLSHSPHRPYTHKKDIPFKLQLITSALNQRSLARVNKFVKNSPKHVVAINIPHSQLPNQFLKFDYSNKVSMDKWFPI